LQCALPGPGATASRPLAARDAPPRHVGTQSEVGYVSRRRIRLSAPEIGLLAGLLGMPHAAVGQEAPDRTATPESEAPEELEVREVRPRFDEVESDSAIKSGALLRELPLAAEVLAGGIVEDSQYRGLAGVLDSFSLTVATPGERGLYEEIMLRGFTEIPFYRDGLNDSLGGLAVREMANVESIEILKGPNAAIYGPGEPGGSINLETKKPLFEPFHEATAALGSHDRYRFELDSTGPVTDGGLAYRMIGVVEDAGSVRDFVDTNRIFAAPSLQWNPAAGLEILAALEYLRHEAPFDSGVVAVDGAFPLPRSRFLGEPDVGRQTIEAFTATLSADYELSDAWKLSGAVYWQDSELKGLKVEPAELDDVDPSAPSAVLARELHDESVNAEVLTTQLEAEGRFHLAGAEHRLLAGYEFSTAEDAEDILASDSDDEPWAIDVFDVEYGQPRPEIELDVSDRESTDLHSLYLQDFIGIADHWRLLAGTRLDMFSAKGRERVEGRSFKQDDEAFSSRVGVVYLHDGSLSVFGSFSESLDPNEGLDPDRNPLRPTRGRAVEAGARFRHAKLGATLDVSVYRIEQTNVTTDAPNAPGFEIQTARQVSEGLDLDLSLRPLEWIRLGLKYGYADSEIRDDPEIPDGTAPPNAPLHKLVIAGLFTFSLVREDDLRIGVDFQYASERQASLDEEELRVRLPDYSLVNGFVDFALTPNLTLALDVLNLGDADYLSGSQGDLLRIVPGQPITFFGSIRAKF
jgi:iron complex outermembrane receptor protein